MENPYGEEQSMNRFLLISVVLHAIVFLTFPQWSSLFSSDKPGMGGEAGIIRIMGVESTASLPSPVTDRLSETTRPRVSEPRPQPEEAPEVGAVAQPEPTQVEMEVAPQPQPDPDPVPEEAQISETPPVEPTEVTVPEPEIPAVAESQPDPVPSELLTSETGPELVVEEAPVEREVVTPPVEERPEPLPEEHIPVEEQHGASGSDTGTQGEDDASGVVESGEGVEESAPSPPPPPPSGSSLHAGGGVPTYPKNAAHEGVEGTVKLAVAVSESGELISIVIADSSGDAGLDQQALRFVEVNWRFESEKYDYIMELFIHFRREQGEFVTAVDYGDVTWINVP